MLSLIRSGCLGNNDITIARVIVITNFFQLCIFVLAMFIGELGGASWNGAAAFLMGSIALSGFFTYEVCRKLDPTLPKV